MVADTGHDTLDGLQRLSESAPGRTFCCTGATETRGDAAATAAAPVAGAPTAGGAHPIDPASSDNVIPAATIPGLLWSRSRRPLHVT
ncbi:hypothetical protein Cs7R123_03940 [Catellatospora sp. TT07R-123]|nr:hypothetical protein Cs7R123_03940 [Catellatospora sp. TT07R-123]